MRKWLRRALYVFLAVLAVGLVYAAGATWTYLHPPPVVVTVEEDPPPGEKAVIARLVRKATAALEHHAEDDHLYKRDAHPVPHGCVRAKFKVRESLEEELRQGIFSNPGDEYLAWIRFSNALIADDREDDGRGMAIKVMTSRPQGNQDFLMVSGAGFFNKDVFEYEEFFDLQVKGHLYQYLYFIDPNPFRWRLHELNIAIDMTRQPIGSPLDLEYFSGLPFKLGPHNIKYRARPCSWPADEEPDEAVRVKKPDEAGPHFLREALVRHLDEESACFDFMVQLQDPSKEMPIEDPTIVWREEDSQFRSVARVDIRPQRFSTDAQNRYCEQLSFSPARTWEEHKGIGGLNRARRQVYEEVSKRRHGRNGYERFEPSDWCLPTDEACPDDESYFIDEGSP